jgi:hypothetical protein
MTIVTIRIENREVTQVLVDHAGEGSPPDAAEWDEIHEALDTWTSEAAMVDFYAEQNRLRAAAAARRAQACRSPSATNRSDNDWQSRYPLARNPGPSPSRHAGPSDGKSRRVAASSRGTSRES